MNIGVFTHCVANNCGANLQALSTGLWLRNNGYTPVFIRWDEYLKIEEKIMNPLQSELHQSFLSRYGFEVTEPCVTDEDFRKVLKKYDIENIIVGSDCVLTYSKPIIPYVLTRRGFKKVIVPSDFEFPNPFWLPFIQDDDKIKRYMISASSGSTRISSIKGAVKEQMKELLSKYDYISVRDTNAKKMINYLFGEEKGVTITPDPVFGLDDDSLDLPTKSDICKKYNLPNNYLVVSFFSHYWPSQDWINSLCEEASKHNLSCVGVPTPAGGKQPTHHIDIQLPLDPIDWYCLIKYSSGYIGNKMHPLIVSLHNVVPFFSYNIHGRFYLRHRFQSIKSSKEHDLLKRFGLEGFEVAQLHSSKISAKYVVEKLLDFDYEDRKKIADIMKKEHSQMMKSIKTIIDAR